MNTWERHGSGHRPDAPAVDSRHITSSLSDGIHELGNSSNNTSGNSVNEKSLEDKGIHGDGVFSEHRKISAKTMPITSELSAASHVQSLKSQNLWVTGQIGRTNTSDQVLCNNEVQRDLNTDHLVNDTEGRFLFARTRSSPELTDAYGDVLSQVRHNREGEIGNAHSNSANGNRRKNIESENLASHSRLSAEDTSSVRHLPSQQCSDAVTDSKSGLNNYQQDLHLDALSEEFPSTSGAPVMHQEEQDIVNMMASASLQGFNGQLHVPFNVNSAHMPFPIPPSFLTSMRYNQWNLPGFLPANIPFVDPSFSNMQFPHGLVSPQLTQYFPGMEVNSPSEVSFERNNENIGSGEMNSEELDNDFWQEQDISSSGGYDRGNGNVDMLQSHDKPQAFVPGPKYVPPPRANSSGSAARVQQKHTREKRGSVRPNSDNLTMHDDRSSEVYGEERSVSSRFSTHSNSLRSRTSSESSWDGSSGKTPKSTKEKRGKKIVSTDLTTGHGKGKIMSEHLSNPAEDDDQEWGSLSNTGTETVERNPGSEPIVSWQVPRHHMPSFEVAHTSVSDSMTAFAPMLIGPGSRQRINDNSGLVAFYPTGPPIPFLTMLPVYNIPPETGTSDASSGHFGGEETLESSESGQNLSPEGYEHHSEDLNPSSSYRGTTTTEASEKKTSDILNSDFASHWQNLQFGRFCQDPRLHGPLMYPSSPVMVPPVYLQGRFPYDNPGRPFSTNANLFNQLMTSYGHRLVPVAPLQSVPNRPPNIYQHYVDDMPRYRSGTGTYLPNPQKVSVRDRHSSGTRRGNYNYDRNDNYGDREGNWTANPKPRASVRNHNRNQTEKNSRADRSVSSESRADRSWNSYRHESISSYQSHNGPLNSNSNQNDPQNMAYSMYPLASTNPNGVPNGSVPPVMMLYPFNHSANYGSHGEQLEFGSLGPVGLPGVDEQSELNDLTRARAFEEHRFHGSSDHLSLDQPSSPHHQRRI